MSGLLNIVRSYRPDAGRKLRALLWLFDAPDTATNREEVAAEEKAKEQGENSSRPSGSPTIFEIPEKGHEAPEEPPTAA